MTAVSQAAGDSPSEVGEFLVEFSIPTALANAIGSAAVFLIVLVGVYVIVALFLWFAVALTLLKIAGMGDISASLGTATGFIGLGVAFALKEMIADTVAGVYLLRDPDFNIGDQVNTASVTAEVSQVGLRKTRIHDERTT